MSIDAGIDKARAARVIGPPVDGGPSVRPGQRPGAGAPAAPGRSGGSVLQPLRSKKEPAPRVASHGAGADAVADEAPGLSARAARLLYAVNEHLGAHGDVCRDLPELLREGCMPQDGEGTCSWCADPASQQLVAAMAASPAARQLLQLLLLAMAVSSREARDGDPYGGFKRSIGEARRYAQLPPARQPPWLRARLAALQHASGEELAQALPGLLRESAGGGDVRREELSKRYALLPRSRLLGGGLAAPDHPAAGRDLAIHLRMPALAA